MLPVTLSVRCNGRIMFKLTNRITAYFLMCGASSGGSECGDYFDWRVRWLPVPPETSSRGRLLTTSCAGRRSLVARV